MYAAYIFRLISPVFPLCLDRNTFGVLMTFTNAILGFRWKDVVRLLGLIAFACILVSCTNGDHEKKLNIGDNAPDFTMKGLDGAVVKLSDFAGSPVVVRFFLTDCKFCRADTPVFNDYYFRYKDKGLKFLYVDSLDMDQGVLAAFKKELAIPFPVVLDQGGLVSKRYNVKALPQTIILDPQHKIIAAILGGVSEEELSGILAPYIN